MRNAAEEIVQHGRGVRRKGRFRVTDSGTDGVFGRRDRIRRHTGPDIEAANYAAKSLSVLRTDESAKQPSPIAGRRAQSRKMSKDHSRISRTEPVGLIPRHLHIRLLHAHGKDAPHRSLAPVAMVPHCSGGFLCGHI